MGSHILCNNPEHVVPYAEKQVLFKNMIGVLKDRFPKARLNTDDGCRFDLPEGWIHIRTSNTEPIMRIIFETKKPAIAERFRQMLESVCRDVLNP